MTFPIAEFRRLAPSLRPDEEWVEIEGVSIHKTALLGFHFRRLPSVARRPVFNSAIHIGRNTEIGPGVILYAGCSIGRDCFIAPRAQIRENASIGDQAVLGYSCEIGANVKAGARFHVQSFAYVVADSTIGDNVFWAQHALSANDIDPRSYEWRAENQGVTIGDYALIGAGAYLQPGASVGSNARVGAMSVVTGNVSEGETVKGNPARADVVEFKRGPGRPRKASA